MYRAKDTRLDRTVAIKVLPAEVASEPDRRARFEREAKAVSSLNHPHICVLHDIGRQEGIDYLVMEYLEGESLHHRLEKGPLPLDQALRCATEIADALDKAHRSGVIHRDLKPSNVILTKAGAKLLDFGLAKTAKPIVTSDADLSALATARPLTEKGTLLGTLHYMAPEQIEGREADARADIWALGCVLYEMVTGKRAFAGNSHASLIGAVLKDEPRPMRELKPLAPPSFERLVKTCVAKDPDERWQSAHDIVAELRWMAEAGSAVFGAPEPARRRQRERLGWIVAGVLMLFLAAAVQAILHARRGLPPAHVLRLSVMPPEGATVESLSLSPDGRRLAFVASGKDRLVQLWVRPLDGDAAQPLAGTDGAAWPFWSPDSQSLGFFAEGKLKKIPASGGAPEALCDVASARGGTWSRDGTIVFAPNTGSGLYRVSAGGGTVTPLTALDPAGRESSHRWPYFLPDSRHVLYLVQSGLPETAGLYILSVESKQTTRLIAATSNAAYAPPGYLLFDRDGALVAQPFDARGLRVTGDPFVVAPEVAYDGGPFRTDFATSDTGILAYRSLAGTNTHIIWVDRTGKQLGVVSASDSAFNLSLSRDDQRLALSRLTSKRGNRDIWFYDLAHGTNSRFTFDPANELQPLWSPDGSRLVFSSNREGAYNLYQKVTSGGGAEELLLRTNEPKLGTDWSRDGRYIAYEVEDPKTRLDLWVLSLGETRSPVPFLRTEASEGRGRFSPDGRWLAYTSNETGRYEVYVQTFPATGGKWQVSAGGGFAPLWRSDGKELCYITLDRKMMAVEVKAASSLEFGPPKFLFAAEGLDVFTYRSPYAMTADGQRFLMDVRVGEATTSPITLLVNWAPEARK